MDLRGLDLIKVNVDVLQTSGYARTEQCFICSLKIMQVVAKIDIIYNTGADIVSSSQITASSVCDKIVLLSQNNNLGLRPD